MINIRQLPAVRLLSIRPFRALVAGNFSNFMGVELRIMAQSWLILELGASQIWVGAATGLRVIPAILLGLFAGVMVDRLGGRVVLIWERSLLLALAVLTAVVVVSGAVTLWQIVVLSIVSSAVLAIGMPAMQTLVISYVPKSALQAGNSMNMLTNSMARAIGPLSGGFLIAGFGLGSPFLALIGLYALSLFFSFRLPKTERSPRRTTSAIREIADGLKYIRSNPVVLRLMILAFSVIFNATFVPIIPVYARDRFDVGETGFGVMLAAWAIGQGASALWIVSKRDWERKIPPILGSTVMFVVSVSTFALSTSFPLTLLSLALVGAAIPIWASSTITLLQTQSDPKMIGRVMSVFSLSLQSMMFGWFLGAWIGTIIGNAQMILIGTAIYAVLNIGIIFSSRELRRL
ncbi:MAG: MFS transporter [Planctomycetes bacterium]|nr:MFS transporter [Planctomycetota bacterium]